MLTKISITSEFKLIQLWELQDMNAFLGSFMIENQLHSTTFAKYVLANKFNPV